jgi:hypothetical protein
VTAAGEAHCRRFNLKKLVAAILVLVPSFVFGQTVMDGYNKYMRDQARFEQEQEMRRLQIERMRGGQAADPVIDRQLHDADAQRAADACRKETYVINGRTMVCKVCPGQRTTTCDE